MKSVPLTPFAFAFNIIVLSSSIFWAASAHKHEDYFLGCLSHHSPDDSSISKVLYTPLNTSYSSILNYSIQNLRFSAAKTPKPLFIITPSHISHIQAAVICSKIHGLQIRTRSGGHDFEGLSYVSDLPFILLDLINLRSITISTEDSTAWVQSGATLGELYYRIAQQSRTLAFPAGSCPTVGVGGHLSGGGYGYLLRKYGLAADHVIDAYLVDADGRALDRGSMGEDLFWAIRGGGGGSFGIVVAWKLRLVPVPATLTTCTVNRTLAGGAVKLIHRWQYVAHKLEDKLLLGVSLSGGNILTQGGGKTNPIASFPTYFLGKVDELVAIMNTTFPELGLAKEDCIETSWIESNLITAGFSAKEALEILLYRTPLISLSTKIKSDYVKEPISEATFEGIWERLKTQDIELAQVMFVPYGGRMSEVSESETPYPHGVENLYKMGYIVKWEERSAKAEKRHLTWVREIYDYMAPFVSKSPRTAYVNYRDLDIGTNNMYGKTSYERARVWGLKYFGKNFDKLVQVKTRVDPYNFFRHEQSIPTFSSAYVSA